MVLKGLCESLLSFYFTGSFIAAVLQGINLSYGTAEELQGSPSGTCIPGTKVKQQNAFSMPAKGICKWDTDLSSQGSVNEEDVTPFRPFEHC